MAADVYRAISSTAQELGIPLAVHTYYLEDTKDLLRAGADFVAHSVRDVPVDAEFVELIKDSNACYSPTLTREVSTFVYENEVGFFSDPFFLREVDADIVTALREPQRQLRLRDSASAQQYKASLPVAMNNLKTLADAGVRIAMGTDSGPVARFQGYFEHLEMWMMADAGMEAMQILQSATSVAAQCLGMDEVGTLEVGKWADLLVLERNPLEDIRNTRSLEMVWIAGNRVPD
jgi:imidazolonepropionase-like amidohydrolase